MKISSASLVMAILASFPSSIAHTSPLMSNTINIDITKGSYIKEHHTTSEDHLNYPANPNQHLDNGISLLSRRLQTFTCGSCNGVTIDFLDQSTRVSLACEANGCTGSTNPAVMNFLDGDRIDCLDENSCNGFQVRGDGDVVCSVANACTNAVYSGVDLLCSESNACSGATLVGGQIDCNTDGECDGASVVQSRIRCAADGGCAGFTSVTGPSTFICGTVANACNGVSPEDGDAVFCEVANACTGIELNDLIMQCRRFL